ncbi:MAG TPA: hypothetical protein VFA63_12365, partial [Pseudonocardiaceae bacterium]|nr:hypothetical protein [Pseudonocardiaceae bacterium]
LNEIEFQRVQAIGKEMEYFTSEMKALDNEGRALVPNPDDPAAIFRRRLELTDRGPAEIDQIIDQIGWLIAGHVPDAITNEFAAYRATHERTQCNVECDVVAVLAQLTGSGNRRGSPPRAVSRRGSDRPTSTI